MPLAPRLRKTLRVFGIFAVVPLGLVALALAGCQGRLIYPGVRYPSDLRERLPTGLVPISYQTDEGQQISFYIPPRSTGVPRRLWLLCNGNGSCALNWLELLAGLRDADAGYLLFEYPGYGFCEGSCTPGRILAASEAAVAALRSRLAMSEDDFAARLGVFGHSLGAAAALQYAARHPVRRVVLAAPFTSMVEMGHRVLFWPCGQLVWHRFDNADRLAEIARQRSRPPVEVLHGDLDSLIPPEMSERLAAAQPWVKRTLVTGVGHDEIAIPALARLDEGSALSR